MPDGSGDLCVGDLNPLDVRDPDDMAWLLACIWPEHTERRERLVAAAAVDTVTTRLRPPPQAMSPAFFVVALNGTRSLAISDPHGRWLSWDRTQAS